MALVSEEKIDKWVDHVKELEEMIEEEKKRGLVGHHMTVALAGDNNEVSRPTDKEVR
jgi:hypothetical protein